MLAVWTERRRRRGKRRWRRKSEWRNKRRGRKRRMWRRKRRIRMRERRCKRIRRRSSEEEKEERVRVIVHLSIYSHIICGFSVMPLSLSLLFVQMAC